MPRSARPTRFRDRWRIRWFDHNGKRCSAVFETHEEADRALRARQVEVDEIRRGLRRAPPPTRTFMELVAYWREHRLPEKRSAKDDESILRRHLVPSFGDHTLSQIGVAEIAAYRREREHLSPKTVSNHLTLLRTMLHLAVDLGWLAAAPPVRKPRVDPDDEFEQPWLRSSTEIDRLLTSAKRRIEPRDPHTEVPFVLDCAAVYTGMRAGELAGLRWSDVDLTRRSILVRRSYDGRTKTRAFRRHVPVVDALFPVLKAWRLRCPVTEDNLVFPNRAGRMHDRSARIFQETLHRVLDDAGFVRPTSGRYKHVIHFHSLRHTFACHWRLNGGSLDELIRVLGHTSKAMTEHYANVGGYHRPDHFALFPARSGTSGSDT